jgi:hypothetical protein
MLKQILHAGNCLKQCFPNLFARGPLFALKINHVSSHPCPRKHSVRMTGIQNYIYIYIHIYIYIYIYIYVADSRATNTYL